MRLLHAVVFLLILPAAFASIDLTLQQEYVNIGDSIEIEASVDAEQSMNAFVRFTAVCGSFSLPYFLTPIETQEGFRTQVSAPPLKATAFMRGQCAIKAELVDENGGVVESATSSSFTVSDGLSIALVGDDMSTLPGATKEVEGIVRGAGDKLVNADISFTFDEETYITSTFNGKFIVMLSISPTAKTGMHPLTIVADDGKQNRGSYTGEIEVVAVPSQIAVEVQPAEQEPGKEISYIITVIDQANDLIADAAEVHITQPDGVFLFKGDANSGEAAQYTLSQYSPPGEYVLKALYKNLGAEARFSVKEVKNIRIAQEGQSVIVENTGNVPYEEEVTILVEGAERTYVVKEDVELAPGQVRTIELSKEVPYGHYNILVPDFMAQVENESIGGQVLAENVEIQDERSSLKKVGSGLGSITGNIVGADGIIARNGWAAPMILVGIIVVIGLYFTRDIWLLMLMRRR